MEPSSSTPSEHDDVVEAIEPASAEAAIEPTVAEPEPVEPEPVEAELVEPEPVEAELVEPEPVESAPVPPAPEPVAPSALALDETEAVAPTAPDLGAVDAPASQSGQATNLDLPDLELPYPAAPPRPAAPSPTPQETSGSVPAAGEYDVEALARQSYGEPAPEPAAPAAAPYADSPYAASPGAYAPTADPAHSQPAFGQEPTYGQPAYGQLVPGSGLSATDQQTWSTAAHWSSLLLSLVSLPFLGPLLIMLIQGPKDARVRANAVESLNFDLTCIIAMLASFLLMFVLIGFITAPIVGIFWLVFKIVATIQTSNGRDYRYPLTIRMVK